ncbi:MAG: hypothetical protein QM767_18715 [Anaeromyxobacter sp.]
MALRRTHAALRTGAIEHVWADSSGHLAFVRQGAGEALLVVADLAGAGGTATLDLSGTSVEGGATPAPDLLDASYTAPPVTAQNLSTYPVALPPLGVRVIPMGP